MPAAIIMLEPKSKLYLIETPISSAGVSIRPRVLSHWPLFIHIRHEKTSEAHRLRHNKDQASWSTAETNIIEKGAHNTEPINAWLTDAKKTAHVHYH